MAVVDSELKFYYPETISDAGGNGGYMSENEIVNNQVQNVFPHAPKAERDAGSTKYRKIFLKNTNDNDEVALYGKWYQEKPTDAADDRVCFFAGTQRNTQADITGSERKYGAAYLKNDVSSGSNQFTVTVEHADYVGIYADADEIRISDKATPESGTGNEEFHVINGAPSVVGLDITITIVGTLANSYLAATPTKVSSIYAYGSVQTSFDSWDESSFNGTYDESTYPPELDNIGTIDQDWTITFSDATNFTVTGSVVGSIGSGTTSADFIPSNPDFSKPYMTIRAAGWGGTPQSGDTITFTTHPASFPIWERRDIAAGAGSLSGNKIVAAVTAESA